MHPSKIFTIFLVVIGATHCVTGYRVLGIFPFEAVSHFNFFRPILRALSNLGHDVTVVSYFPDPTANYTDNPLGKADEQIFLSLNVSLAIFFANQ